MPIAWVNIPVYDYKGLMRAGHHTLYLWPISDTAMLCEEYLNPIGKLKTTG